MLNANFFFMVLHTCFIHASINKAPGLQIRIISPLYSCHPLQFSLVLSLATQGGRTYSAMTVSVCVWPPPLGGDILVVLVRQLVQLSPTTHESEPEACVFDLYL